MNEEKQFWTTKNIMIRVFTYPVSFICLSLGGIFINASFKSILNIDFLLLFLGLSFVFFPFLYWGLDYYQFIYSKETQLDDILDEGL